MPDDSTVVARHTMSVSDTAKEVVRIASTAGVAKDVIDLMEKKLAILTSELDTATDKFALVEKLYRSSKVKEP